VSRLLATHHHRPEAVPTFMSQLKIREMPEEERPREKLLARGPDALTNAELIAILLRTGRPGMNVVEVARELLDRYKSFAELSRCSVQELSKIKGIGPAKALELVAAFNLGKRFAQEPLFQQKLDSRRLAGHSLPVEARRASVTRQPEREHRAPARNFSSSAHLFGPRRDRRSQSPVRRRVAEPDRPQPYAPSG